MSFILLDMICSLNTLMQDTKVGWSDVREATRTCIPSQLASIDVIPAKLGYLNDDSTIKQYGKIWRIQLYETRLFRTVARR